jgi:hypothetical protein
MDSVMPPGTKRAGVVSPLTPSLWVDMPRVLPDSPLDGEPTAWQRALALCEEFKSRVMTLRALADELRDTPGREAEARAWLVTLAAEELEAAVNTLALAKTGGCPAGAERTAATSVDGRARWPSISMPVRDVRNRQGLSLGRNSKTPSS